MSAASLFAEKLAALAQSGEKETWLSGVCRLLRECTGADAVLRGGDGGEIAKSLIPSGANGEVAEKKYSLLLPVYGDGMKLGAIALSRRGAEFSEDEMAAFHMALAFCAVLLKARKDETETEQRRRGESVKAAVNSLSFSELEAAVLIFQTLEGKDGLLVASRAAQKLGVNRSVAVNALRKLEGAGMVETRSLGMKGTHIRVLNPLLAEELGKLSKRI
ncbi:MAG: hypothetical protein LBR83_09465 [Clostridiales bacterium]|jgi:transcriptional pleiotropic repressor|nr:hypothetical protein [Clostridiales bacterium]